MAWLRALPRVVKAPHQSQPSVETRDARERSLRTEINGVSLQGVIRQEMRMLTMLMWRVASVQKGEFLL